MKKFMFILALMFGGFCSVEATMEEEVPDVVKNHIQKAERLAIARKTKLNKLVELSGLWRQSLDFERTAWDNRKSDREDHWKVLMEKEKGEWIETRHNSNSTWKDAIERARNSLLNEDVDKCEKCIKELKEILGKQKSKVKMVRKHVKTARGKRIDVNVPVLID